MKRLLYLDAQPYSRAKEVAEQNWLNVLAPTHAAARGLGSHKRTAKLTQTRSLQDLATELLQVQGIAIASPLNVQRALHEVINQIVQPQDTEGIARAWMPTIQALLKSAPLTQINLEACSDRARQLIAVTQRYQQILRQRNWVDPGEVLWRAIELEPQPIPVLIYGYFQPRPDELAFINHMAAEGSIFFLPLAGEDLFQESQVAVTWLQQQGWKVDAFQSLSQTVGERLGQQFLTSSNVMEQSSAYAYCNVEAEVRGTLAQVKQLLHEGISARDIAIVARDEVAYGPKLLEVAWEYGVPLRALYATPLNTTRFGAWIALLLEVIEQRFPFEATAKLLSHPLCTNPDAEFWSMVRSQHPVGLTAWQEICQNTLHLDLAVLKIGHQARRDTWVATLQTILKTFDLRRRCSRWARESLAFNALNQALVDLSKPEDEKLAWSAFAQEVRSLLVIVGVPAQPGRGGVELHSPASVIGAHYPYLFVIGMAEGGLPAPVRNDCILDFYERKALRQVGIPLELAAEAARKEALLFYYLLQTVTQSVVFSYARLNGRQEQLPSPYLAQLGLEATMPPEMPIASLEELRKVDLRRETHAEDPVLQTALHAWRVERQRESSAPPDEYDGITGVPLDYRDRTFSVSQLNHLGLCPFKWFADKVLQLGEPQEEEEELSPSRRGNLYHRVLELVFKEWQENRSRSLQDPTLLEAKFQAVEREMRLTSLPVWTAQRVEHLQTLKRVLNQPDFFPEGTEAIALEAKFEGIWYDLKLTGRIDRIDRASQGLVLIDYKTSSNPPKGVSNAAGKASIDLQLPIYQHVAAKALFPEESVATAYYYSLTKAKKLSKKIPDETELAGVAERCKAHLSLGHFPVQPDVDKVACNYCAFDLMCRQGNRLSRKPREGNTHESD
ncbi:PD-(D/E)XK nuclease family protein (plasmid) [Kovacikia minuta CCNUW1]|uniref:PD-(D/E)XK nuclease family protein n=1 Tax=Kovacikia minuta TaxID=2931930 RepID=UPI001CCE874B|nr:PD-(D/E)XK nuclease family protein [Kovacikia minuta]UBF30456.1 PD-(D/E)XK nuclease family protein [Kovacikia minuta CCNUW1]